MSITYLTKYLQHVRADYSSLATSDEVDAVLTNVPATLVCDQALQLPSEVFVHIQDVVKSFSELREFSEYQTHCLEKSVGLAAAHEYRSPHYSVLMSYDFHLTNDGQLKLIEINTNASQSLILDLGYKTQGLPTAANFEVDVMTAFKNEFQLFARNTSGRTPKGNDSPELKRIAIVDDQPRQQKMYLEFLLYQDLFRRNGIDARICDPSELHVDTTTGKVYFAGADAKSPAGCDVEPDRAVDLIYNRLTDFFLSEPKQAGLRHALKMKSVCLTPHPFEYLLLADKERLFELSHNPDWLARLAISDHAKKQIGSVLIPTLSVKDVDVDKIWSERKKYFFKPKRSFGGKAAYRGSSVSRGTFENILKGDYVAQEFVPAGTRRLHITDADGTTHEKEMKFDLRAYVYRDQVQSVGARFYEGQMTNSQTVGGGMAPVIWA